MAGTERPINARETRAMLRYVGRALSADTDRDRDAALDEGLVAWGKELIEVLRYLARESEAMRPLAERGMDRFVRWLGGATLTRRADEDERRALAAVQAATAAPGLSRLAVEGLLRLPPEHPLRRAHLGTMLEAVRARLEELKRSGPADEVLITLSTLLGLQDDSGRQDELVEEGFVVLESNPGEEAEEFRVAAAEVLLGRAIQERDAANADAQHQLADRGRRVLAPLLDGEAVAGDPYRLVLGALLAEVEENAPAAFELHERALAADLEERQRVQALLGLLRAGILTGQYQSVISYGSSMLDLVVQRYAIEVNEAEVADRAEDLGNAVTRIATACVALGDLEHLLLALERASSARLRHRSLLRQGRAGRRIRRLEEALWAVERGAPVDARATGLAVADGRAVAALTLQSRLQEAYRTAGRRHAERFDPPDPGEVTRRLRADEGIVVLGVGSWGTALLFLRRAEPLAGEVLTEGTLASWTTAFVRDETGRDETGWAYVLGAPWEYRGDPRADLDVLLARAEDLVGGRVGSWARANRLRRLWVVPHGWLALVPWWALPSLHDLDVRTAPALGLFPRRRGVASLRGRAVVVGDPTGDLPIARAEACGVRGRLETAGIRSDQVLGEEATEDTITRILDGARLLHFSGHGMSELSDASRSALHVHPVHMLAGTAGASLVDELASGADWRTRPDGLEEAEVEPRTAGLPPTVRLVAETLTGGATLRHLEYGPTGTLLAAYVDGRLVRLAELWSAGDVAVSGALRAVRLAVLSACQSGGGVLAAGPDEFAGLPAALTLAGVRTVVCTAWKVDDALAALAVDLLWEELCRDPGRTVDLGATVSDLRRRLAGMPSAEAAERLERLRLAAPNPRARFLLEARRARIREGPPRPFTHPYDWAPLFVLGEPLVTWRTR